MIDDRFDPDVGTFPSVQFGGIEDGLGAARAVKKIHTAEIIASASDRIDDWAQGSHPQSTREQQDVLADELLHRPRGPVGATHTEPITDA